MIILTPKRTFKVPIDAENVTPDAFAGKGLDEVKAVRVWEGNRKRILGDLFTIQQRDDVQDNDLSIRIEGDLTKVKRIGTNMSRGHIVVEGDVGMRLGENMKGGTITVKGNVDSWVGMMMQGGIIEVTGNAGDYVGASYRGSTIGMTGGTIIVRGNAGNEVGCFMNTGLIQICGNVGLFVGMHMRGGAILVEGDAEGRVGAQMMGGRIIVLGTVPSILPGFIIDNVRKSVRFGKNRFEGPFYLFKGDVTESWNGSIYISTMKNLHLNFYKNKIV